MTARGAVLLKGGISFSCGREEILIIITLFSEERLQ